MVTSIPWAVRLSWLLKFLGIHAPFFSSGDFDPTDLVLACDQGSLVGQRMQDYKSVCSGYDLFHTLRHTDTQRFDQLTVYEKLSQLSNKCVP